MKSLKLVIVLFLCLSLPNCRSNTVSYDIVIYGGSSPAVAAAIQATRVDGSLKVLMIVPEKVLGSIQTAGAQNFWDLYHYKGKMPQGGSMRLFLKGTSQFFPPALFAEQLARYVDKPNITIMYNTDIDRVKADNGSIKSVHAGGSKIRGKVYIDASETGRLASVAPHTVGREDQGKDTLQMAATLMFKMKGLDFSKVVHLKSFKGYMGAYGGNEIYDSPIFQGYNHSPLHPFRVKPYNAAEDQAGEYWMNMFQIFGVDGTDKEEVESAYRSAVNEISKPSFIGMLRTLIGFENAELVTDKDGNPVVADILYLRETIHAINPNGSYALSYDEVKANQRRYYNDRIGLGLYGLDNNGYRKDEGSTWAQITTPWDVPYEALISPKFNNLLICGYAANMDSKIFSAMRVYPNLVVLGDASGTVAALTAQGKFRMIDGDISVLQKELKKAGAILELK